MSDLKNILPQTHNGFVVGWRAWKIDEGALFSLVAEYAWPPLKPTTGDIDDEAEISYMCSKPTGVYAMKSLRALVGELQHGGRADGYIFGAVALWGDIAEHEHGYRASYAYPVAIATKDRSLAINEIALAYGVTACALEDLEPVTNELMEGKLWTLANRSNVTPLSPSPPSDLPSYLTANQANIQSGILWSALSQNAPPVVFHNNTFSQVNRPPPLILRTSFPKLVADEASDVKPPSENDGPKVLVTLWCAFVGMIASLWLVRWLAA